MAENGKKTGTRALGIIGVISNFGIAPLAPRSTIGRLVKTLECGSEDARKAAYMALVKLGKNYAGFVVDSFENKTLSIGAIQVLGDMGNADIIPRIESFVSSENEQLADAARESIELLREMPNSNK